MLPSFPLSIFWKETQLIPIKEEYTVIKNGWFALGNVSVTFFVTKVLIR